MDTNTPHTLSLPYCGRKVRDLHLQIVCTKCYLLLGGELAAPLCLQDKRAFWEVGA